MVGGSGGSLLASYSEEELRYLFLYRPTPQKRSKAESSVFQQTVLWDIPRAKWPNLSAPTTFIPLVPFR